MDYVILAYRTDGSITELFRTGSSDEAVTQFNLTNKWSYQRVVLAQELRTK